MKIVAVGEVVTMETVGMETSIADRKSERKGIGKEKITTTDISRGEKLKLYILTITDQERQGDVENPRGDIDSMGMGPRGIGMRLRV